MAGLEGLLGALFNVVGKTAYYGAKGAWSVGKAVVPPAMSTAFGVGVPLTKAAGIGAGKAVGFGLRHPEIAMGMGVAGLGVYAAMDAGAEDREMSDEQVERLAQQTGSSTGFAPGQASYAYDPTRMAFIDSTYGLSLGLHRGRHGG